MPGVVPATDHKEPPNMYRNPQRIASLLAAAETVVTIEYRGSNEYRLPMEEDFRKAKKAPLYEACRVLKNQYDFPDDALVVAMRDGKPSMRVRLSKGAELTIHEGPSTPLRIGRYEPLSTFV